MKRQIVNLLPKVAARAEEHLSGGLIFKVITVCFLSLGLVYGVLWFMMYQAKTKLTELNAEKNIVSQQVMALKQQLPSLQGDLKVETLKLRQEETEKLKAELLANLQKIKVQMNKVGFANCLDVLAKITPKGIWLTNINFANGHESVQLIGKSESSLLIPTFLHALAGEKAFENKKFYSINIKKQIKKSKKKEEEETAPETTVINFVLETVKSNV